LQQGSPRLFRGISLASNLSDEKVNERMAARCRELLAGKVPVEFEVLHDSSALQKGATLFLRADTTTGCILGADHAGKPGRRSEAIAEFVVSTLREDLATGATVDRHLADQLILFAALAEGKTSYRVPMPTEHVESNLWLVETMLGARTAREGNVIAIGGIGLAPPGR
jgi:RNA 3'-terminal phosphate cyclase (ATP)